MKWIPYHTRHDVRLIGVLYRKYPGRVLTIGLWFGRWRWEIDT